MALQASGNPISMSNIGTEFGRNRGNTISLGDYRISESYGSMLNLPLDAGIPQSGTIRLSDFYSKRLNVIVNYYTSDIANKTREDSDYQYNARTKYNNQEVNVVGGFRTRPANSGGAKVFIHVNRRIGSLRGNQFFVALRTGTWNAGTDLRIINGPNGQISGAGGNGGNSNSGSGRTGSSAIGIEHPSTQLQNNGLIQCGWGGGGAGARRARNVKTGKKSSVWSVSTGGGGGGGAGWPPGAGGIASSDTEGVGTKGSNGQPGTFSTGGAGGAGGSEAGAGGRGGFPPDTDAANGGGTANGAGGAGGSRGFALVVTLGSSISSISGNNVVGPVRLGVDPRDLK
jgi:hypothetical protein